MSEEPPVDGSTMPANGPPLGGRGSLPEPPSVEPVDDEAATRPQHRTTQVRVIAGRYRLVRRIAGGSFGDVFEAQQRIGDGERRVAIKLLRTGITDQARLTRFQEEIKTLCMLGDRDHPNICNVIDGGVDGDQPYLVMDFADGGSLRDKLKASPTGRIDAAVATTWLREAASGLLAAEQNCDAKGNPAPIYHRDVKSENLLLQRGRVVVADFGAAKLGGTNPGVTCQAVLPTWTPAYGAPEQERGSADQRSDVYALGTTFFELLTGKPPIARFAHQTDRFTMAHDPSLACPGVPKGLGAIVRKMTEPVAAHRYQSFADLIAAIDRYAKPSATKWPVWLLSAVLLSVTAVVVLEATGLVDVRAAPADARAERLADGLEQQLKGYRDLVQVAREQPRANALKPAEEGLQAATEQMEKRLATAASAGPTDIDWKGLADLAVALEEAIRLYQLAGSSLARIDAVRDPAVRSCVATNVLAAWCTGNDATREFPELERGRAAAAASVQALFAQRCLPVLQMESALRLGAHAQSLQRAYLPGLTASLERCGENDLSERAKLALAATAAALAHLEGLPALNLDTADKALALESFVMFARRYAARPPSVVDVALRSCWLRGSTMAASNAADTVRTLESFADFAAKLGATPHASIDAELRSWWGAFRKRTLEQNCLRVLGIWRNLHSELTRKCADLQSADGEDKRRRDAVAAREQYDTLATQLRRLAQEEPKTLGCLLPPNDAYLATPNVPPPPAEPVESAPRWPDDWCYKDFLPPSQVVAELRSVAVTETDERLREIYSDDALRALKGNRLWYLAKRTRVRDADAPVFMAFCENGKGGAWLIDVHPVTVGEIDLLPAFRYGDPNDSIMKVWLDEVERVEGGRRSQRLARCMNLDVAQRFAAAVKAGGYLLTVPPDDFSEWDDVKNRLLPIQRQTPSGLFLEQTADVSTTGLAFTALRAVTESYEERKRLRETVLRMAIPLCPVAKTSLDIDTLRK